MKIGAALPGFLVLATVAVAQDTSLMIPQIEGGKQGRVVGRAIACGLPRERTEAYLRTARERMLRAVGGPFTEDRYLPALAQAIEQETSLGKPSDAACAKAAAEFERLETAG